MVINLDSTFTGYIEFKEHHRTYYEHGKIHREDGPAITTPSRQAWYSNGVKHREDGPALIINQEEECETQEWWINGERHRADGPAYICRTSTQIIEQWYQGNMRHRRGGPAVTCRDRESRNLRYEWWEFNVLHRFDGPAIEIWNDDILKEYKWYENGELHRLDGPAIMDIPYATIGDNSVRFEWHENGKLHRLDGPARLTVGPDGNISNERYYLHDTYFELESFNKIVAIIKNNPLINLFEDDFIS